MFVVFDTTAITSDPLCAGTAWRVLAHGASRWNAQLFTTSVVLAKAVANHGRAIGHAVEGLQEWREKYGRLGLYAAAGSFQGEVKRIGDGYEQDLASRLEELQITVLDDLGFSHMEIVRRAATRTRPLR